MDALLRGIIYCSCCGSGMYSTYSANEERRYRYYVCYRSQQKLEGYCTSRAVSAPSVEDAVVKSIRRVGVHLDVLAETAQEARQLLAEIITGLREELNTTNGRVKNLKSQIARLRNSEARRLAEIQEQIAAREDSDFHFEIRWASSQTTSISSTSPSIRSRRRCRLNLELQPGKEGAKELDDVLLFSGGLDSLGGTGISPASRCCQSAVLPAACRH